MDHLDEILMRTFDNDVFVQTNAVQDMHFNIHTNDSQYIDTTNMFESMAFTASVGSYIDHIAPNIAFNQSDDLYGVLNSQENFDFETANADLSVHNLESAFGAVITHGMYSPT